MILKPWLVAARPWALPASAVPVVFGTALAAVFGGAGFAPLRFLWALATMALLHAAANMLNDVSDRRRDLDRGVTPTSGAVVRGLLTDRQVLKGAVALFALGTFSGLLLARLTGPALLLVGGAGVAVGASYALFKARALGDLAVFLDFGLLGSLGAWIVQTGSFSWLPVVWAVPTALLVAAILHANNWRDAVSDRDQGLTTAAGLLGDRGSLAYYGFLLFAPFFVDVLLVTVPRVARVGIPPMPWTFLIVLTALPGALGLWGRAVRRAAPRRPMDFIALDGATAAYNLVFGLLSTAAAVLAGILGKR